MFRLSEKVDLGAVGKVARPQNLNYNKRKWLYRPIHKAMVKTRGYKYGVHHGYETHHGYRVHHG